MQAAKNNGTNSLTKISLFRYWICLKLELLNPLSEQNTPLSFSGYPGMDIMSRSNIARDIN
jgi:hypothetical protein